MLFTPNESYDKKIESALHYLLYDNFRLCPLRDEERESFRGLLFGIRKRLKTFSLEEILRQGK